MDPNVDHGLFGEDTERAHHKDALKDLGKITKVECIVELGGNRKEFLGNLLVYLNGGYNYAITRLLHIVREVEGL